MSASINRHVSPRAVLSEEDLRAVLEVSDVISSALDLDEVLNLIVEKAAQVTGSEYVSIGLVENGELIFRVNRGYPPGWELRLPLDAGRGITVWALKHNEILNASRPQHDPRFVAAGIPGEVLSEIAVPLSYGGDSLGVLDLESTSIIFDDHHAALVQALAIRAARSIWNARAFGREHQQLLRKIRHLEILTELDKTLSTTPIDLNTVISRSLEHCLEITGGRHAQFLLCDYENSCLVVASEFGATETRLGLQLPLDRSRGVTVHAAKELRQISIGDWRNDHTYKKVYLEHIPGMVSELATPVAHGGRCLGVINLESPQLNAFSDEQAQIVKSICSQIALPLLSAKRLDLVALTCAYALTRRDPQRVLGEIYRGVSELYPGSHAGVFLLDPRRGVLEPARPWGKASTERLVRLRPVALGRGVVGRACAGGETVYERDVLELPAERYVRMIEQTRSSVGIPLRSGQQNIGVLGVESDVPNAFGPEDIRLLGIFASFAAIAIRNSNQIKALESAASVLRKAKTALERTQRRQISEAKWVTLGRVVGQLVHRVSNDMGYADWILNDDLAKHPLIRRHAGPAIREIRRAFRNLARIIQELKNRSLETPELTPQQPARLVAQAISSIRRQPRVKIVNEVPAELPEVTGSLMVVEVVAELIQNALKAARRGKKGRVVVRATESRRHVRILVWNDGAPIPENERRQIFDLFYQASGSDRSGLGFGLWWVSTYLDQIGGTVGLDFSNDQRGTQFSMALAKRKKT